MEYNNVSEANKRIATNIISEIVKPGSQQDFEAWSKRINKVVAQQPGFISSDILRPRDKNHLEYIIIIRFETHDTLNIWRTSETFKAIFKDVEPHLVSYQSQQQSHGIEQWFELPEPVLWFHQLSGGRRADAKLFRTGADLVSGLHDAMHKVTGEQCAVEP